MLKSAYKLTFSALLIALIGLAAPVFGQEEAEDVNTPAALAKRVEDVSARIARRPDRIWISAFELRELAGRDGQHAEVLAPAVSRLLDNESEYVRLAAAQVLLAMGAGDDSVTYEALAELIEETEASDLLAPVSVMLARFQPDGDVSERICEALEEKLTSLRKLTPEARVAMAEALARITGDPLATQRLSVMAAGTNTELRDRAALALARLGEDAEVRGRLQSLAGQSGELALNARLAIEIANDRKVISDYRQMGRIEARVDLVKEVITKVVKNYDGEEFQYGTDTLPLTPSNLVDSAARGMASSLDDFSQYLTATEYRKSQEEMRGQYAGIGAHVTKSDFDPAVRISQPIYEGPAYAAGLRTGDYLWAVELDGKRTELVGKDTEEVRNLLVGEVGTKITLWVKREGAEDLVPITLERRTVNVNTAQESMLPGNIGYVRLTRFGARSQIDLMQALHKLQIQGARGFVLDLRGNGGGFLHIVLQIAAFFLPGDPEIALIRGVYNEYGRDVVHSASMPRDGAGNPVDWPRFSQPLVVLIDNGSASGSELLSGALKDHNRAIVIGQKSFGKGIGQATYPITENDLARESDKDSGRMLKVTVFNYYILPSMTSVDRVGGVGGVVPHIEVHPPIPTTWEFYTRVELDRAGVIAKWVRENWEEHAATFRKLAEFDGGDHTLYPGFEEFYAAHSAGLSRDRIRGEIRNEIRSRVADERGRAFYENYSDDFVLQRGIIELTKKMELDPWRIERFHPFLEEHGLEKKAGE